MLKLGGSWTDVARVFKNVSGIWVEQTDLANVIEDGVKYKNGGEIEITGPTLISFTIDGASYQAEEGMIWGTWVNSDYNTGGFILYGAGYVLTDDMSKAVQNVNSSQAIVSGRAYVLA